MRGQNLDQYTEKLKEELIQKMTTAGFDNFQV